MKFLSVPQLPNGPVAALAMGKRYVPAFQKPLDDLGIELIALPENPALDRRIANHADLALLDLGSGRFAAADGLALDTRIPLVSTHNVYINDSVLNCCAIGPYWIYCPKTTDILPEGYEGIPVRQRYSRCSVCIVDEHSMITADHGIAKAAARKLDVLEIQPGFIKLVGFDTGFIGGASFKLSREILAFTGSLQEHPDRQRIESFLRERNVEAMYLSNETVYDIGSAVLLWER